MAAAPIPLRDLEARFIGAGGAGVYKVLPDGTRTPAPERTGVGVVMRCPCGDPSAATDLYVPFRNPLDGGAPVEPRSHGGTGGWERTGDTIDTLTLSPSVLRVSGCRCGWHGWIRNGHAVGC